MVFYLLLFFELVFSAIIGAVIIKLLLRITYRNRIFDIPEDRKVHSIPVPRLGGMAFVPTIMIELALGIGAIYHSGVISESGFNAPMLIKVSNLLAAMISLYVVGIMDDLSGLNYKIKMLAQLFAAAMLAYSGIWLNNLYGLFGIYAIPAYVGVPLTLLICVAVTNALNMIDGIDGLASGIAIITLSLLAFIYIRERRFLYSSASVSMVGATVAFWFFNMFGKPEKRSKLYMGDTGSMTLGLLISALTISLCSFVGVNGTPTCGKYLAIVASSLMIPMLDVVRLFFTRIIKHKSPFEADTNHIHHRLMRCGLTSRQSLAVILSMTIIMVLLTVVMTRVLSLTAIILIDIALYVVAQLIIHRFIKSEDVPKDLYV